MMEALKQYLFSVITCCMICAIVSKILSDTKGKVLMRLICGSILAVSLLHPLSGLKLEEYISFPAWDSHMAEQYIIEGKVAASEARAGCIKASCEAYILDKARTLGAEVVTQVSLNQELVPVFVEIKGEIDPKIQMQLQNILTMDLGIPKENQQWIWSQENNSS